MSAIIQSTEEDETPREREAKFAKELTKRQEKELLLLIAETAIVYGGISGVMLQFKPDANALMIILFAWMISITWRSW